MEKSLFNIGKEKAELIQKLLRLCFTLRTNKDVKNYKETLNQIEIELDAYLSEEEKTAIEKAETIIKNNLSKMCKIHPLIQKNLISNLSGKSIEALTTKEKILRQKIKSLGLDGFVEERAERYV